MWHDGAIRETEIWLQAGSKTRESISKPLNRSFALYRHCQGRKKWAPCNNNCIHSTNVIHPIRESHTNIPTLSAKESQKTSHIALNYYDKSIAFCFKNMFAIKIYVISSMLEICLYRTIIRMYTFLVSYSR